DVALSEPSLTVRLNVTAVSAVTSPVLNVATAWLALASDAPAGSDEPDATVHAYVSGCPSGSELAEPSRAAGDRSSTSARALAAATGARLTLRTVIDTSDVVVAVPSEAVSRSTNVVSAVTSGAVNEASASAGLLSAMTGAAGETCVHVSVSASPSASLALPCS